MKRSCFFVMLMTCCWLPAWTQSAVNVAKAEVELEKLNREYDEALVRGNVDTLDRLYAEEFVYTTFDGSVRTKAEQLAFTRSGDLKLESGKSDDVRIRVYGSTAVMTGRFRAKGTFKGTRLEVKERYTAVWVRRKGRWRLVAEQGNEIKAEAQ